MEVSLFTVVDKRIAVGLGKIARTKAVIPVNVDPALVKRPWVVFDRAGVQPSSVVGDIEPVSFGERGSERPLCCLKRIATSPVGGVEIESWRTPMRPMTAKRERISATLNANIGPIIRQSEEETSNNTGETEWIVCIEREEVDTWITLVCDIRANVELWKRETTWNPSRAEIFNPKRNETEPRRSIVRLQSE